MDTRTNELLDKVAQINRQLGRMATQETALNLYSGVAVGAWAEAYRIFNVNNSAGPNAFFGASGDGTTLDRLYLSIANGTDAPGEASTVSLSLLASGNVGLGIIAPETRLHVYGPSGLGTATGSYNPITRIGGNVGGDQVSLAAYTYRRANTASNWTTAAYIDGVRVNASLDVPLSTLRTYIERHASEQYIAFGSGAAEFVRMDTNGLGVGATASALYRLMVGGSIAMSGATLYKSGAGNLSITTDSGVYVRIMDATDGYLARLGIGVAPGAPLHIKATNANLYLETAAADQTPELRYYDAGVLKGRLVYAGGNSAGGKYFGFINTGGDYLGFFSATHRFWNLAASARFAEFTATATWLSPRGTSSDLYVNSSGNVGIGTTSPSCPLEVNNTVRCGAYYNRVDNGGIGFGGGTDYNKGAYVSMYGKDHAASGRMDLIYGSAAIFQIIQYDWASTWTVRLHMNTSGQVGIANSDPAYPLDVTGRSRVRSGGGTAGIWYSDASKNDRAFIGLHTDSASPKAGIYVGSWRLLVDSAGLVGIGTESPSTLLHVKGASPEARLESSSSNQTFQQAFYDNGTLKGRIVYAGAAAASSKYFGLVNDAADFLGLYSDTHRHYNASGAHLYMWSFLSSGTPNVSILDNALRVNGSNVIVGGSTVVHKFTVYSGNVGPGTDNANTCGTSGARWSAVYAANGTIQTSDARVKTDIVDSPLGLEFIKALRPVAYKWRVGGKREIPRADGEVDAVDLPGKRTHYGLIAQEVREVIPAGVDFGGWIQDDLANPDSQQSLAYHEFIGPLVRAVQELAARVIVLERALELKEM